MEATPLRFRKKDNSIMLSSGELRLFTIPQITTLHFSSKYVARRRVKNLINEGLLEAKSLGFGRRRGRPERINFLTKKGTDFLKSRNLIPPYVSHESIDGSKIKCIDHQLLLNWFQIHALHIKKVVPELKIEFISSTSPVNLRENSQYPIIYERFQNPSEDKIIDFIPDAVFCITHRENKKSMLFFVEIDMGTETIASPKRKNTDIRQKVLNYQNYFRLPVLDDLRNFSLVYFDYNYVQRLLKAA